jgi:hypothetical protein
MADVLVKVTLTKDSGVPADAVTNSFVFTDLPDFTIPIVDGLAIALEDFYNAVPADGNIAIKDRLSSALNNGADQCRMDFYDIAPGLLGQNLGSPIYSTTWQLAAQANSGINPLPDEVAFCVTLEAQGRANQLVEAPDGIDPGSAMDRPRQRYTGRIFLGPLNDGAKSTLDGVVRPDVSIRDTALLAFKQLQDSVDAINVAMDLAVWSRVDRVVRSVDAVSADNAFDTIRSRGPRSTLRTRPEI